MGTYFLFPLRSLAMPSSDEAMESDAKSVEKNVKIGFQNEDD